MVLTMPLRGEVDAAVPSPHFVNEVCAHFHLIVVTTKADSFLLQSLKSNVVCLSATTTKVYPSQPSWDNYSQPSTSNFAKHTRLVPPETGTAHHE